MSFKRLVTAPFSICVLVLAGSGASIAQDHTAGYEIVRIDDEARQRPVHLDLWYPSTSLESEHSYGISAGRVAPGGEPAGGKFPILLVSHGAMGAASNYSWIAEPLARAGFVVLGISHFGESPVFGPSTVDVANVGRFGDRTRDVDVALEFLIKRSTHADRVDPDRLGLLGHSSGGATALMLAGADFDPSRLAEHCASSAAVQDKGCWYPTPESGGPASQPPTYHS